jgi:GH24 family phage-related lysozyme (muramidase)
MPHAISPEGYALVKRLEGFRANALPLADGRVVVGHGHVASKAPKAPVTAEEADAWLRADLAPVEAMLNARLLTPVSQAQFDALASFAFSIGAEAFTKSDVLRRMNAGEPIAAACAMDAWRKSALGGESAVLDALVRRRAAEKAVFLDLGAMVPAASAFVRPELDHAAAILGSPTEVASLPPSPVADADETTRRLAGILARDPNTAHALRPPPPQPVLEDDEPLVLTRVTGAPPAPGDVSRLALFGLGGAGLFAAGLVALTQGRETLFLLLTAPGAVILLSAAWRLLKDTAVTRFLGALRS